MTSTANVEIKWAHLVSPRGESFQGFWILKNETPVTEKPFTTAEEAHEVLCQMCSCTWEDGDNPSCPVHAN